MGTSETRHRLRGNLNRIKCPRPLDTMSQARNLKLFIIYSRSILKTIEMICVWPVARVEGGHVLLLPPDGDVAHPVLPLQDRLLLWVQPTSAHRVSRLILAQRSLLSGVTSRLARRTWRSKYILKFHVSMILECLFFAITAAPFRCQSLTAHLCSILCPRPVCLSSEVSGQDGSFPRTVSSTTVYSCGELLGVLTILDGYIKIGSFIWFYWYFKEAMTIFVQKIIPSFYRLNLILSSGSGSGWPDPEWCWPLVVRRTAIINTELIGAFMK